MKKQNPKRLAEFEGDWQRTVRFSGRVSLFRMVKKKKKNQSVQTASGREQSSLNLNIVANTLMKLVFAAFPFLSLWLAQQMSMFMFVK